jgi:CDP-glucose 4,6-dehydratase
VAEVVTEILKHRPGTWEDRSDPNAPHEASKLNLSIEKAFHLLQWGPVWSFAETIARTVDWYVCDTDLIALTREQIAAYRTAAAATGLPWAGR